MTIPATAAVPNARLELLRALARWRDLHAAMVRDGDLPADDPEAVPLHAGEWRNAVDDVLVAARECAALGEVDLREEPLGGWVARGIAITRLGYARIRAHDLAGELAQAHHAEARR